MRTIVRTRNFLRNEEAVSEEFTVLPALSVVMIGFAFFVLLVAQTYTAYSDRAAGLQTYQTAQGLFEKLLNPDCFFIRSPGVVDLQQLQNANASLQHHLELYTKAGFFYILKIEWLNQTWIFPESILQKPQNNIQISKEIGIYLNEAQTIPGKMTIVLWR